MTDGTALAGTTELAMKSGGAVPSGVTSPFTCSCVPAGSADSFSVPVSTW